MAVHILVVEDEDKLARSLQLELEFEGYQVSVSYNGREAFEMIQTNQYQLILLDIMLPGLSGIEVLRRIRAIGNQTPVILLTARDGTIDKVSGLDLGASDYVTKPFEIEELLARIRLQIRLTNDQAHRSKKLTIGELIIDQDQYKVYWQGKAIELTKREFDLLYYLALNQGNVLHREQLLNEVWGFNYVGETNVVDVYVRYLRQKLTYELIQTVRGVGYKLRVNHHDT
ncbi:DNA-binding response regulator, OmpR family, contains REC and winged-helix (wHTH) domain [Amphibacillus marinus]|uniref:DNA-binding response regulator, OmpR family, contains REC and winged-helix (WHTH) domain n=1 Tax=Amphibacillus marinus TaxID=872970 RepID=A0A1H8IHZ6_9BACI|nr:DNA-binding response regulator, OmpR family, contains REC and winged-helix (wHTH) domain [Amphibacillus marinus]